LLKILPYPVVGVQRAIAEVGVKPPVIGIATGLAHGVDHDGPLGFVGAEVRGLHLDLLHLIHIDGADRATHVARIDDVGAVTGDVNQALLRRRAIGAIASHAGGCRSSTRPRRVAIQTTRALVSHVPAGTDRETGQHAHQFCRVAPGGGEAVDVAGGDQGAVLAGV